MKSTSRDGGSDLTAHQIWATVTVIVSSLAAIVTLALLHVEVTAILTAIITIVVPVIGSMLHSNISAVREQTNGNTSTLLDMVKRQGDIIATLPPIGEKKNE